MLKKWERFMATGNRPSIYSDRSAIGSAEDLDAYGVWVKSEPQDMASGLADAFGGEAVPYEADFDMELNVGFGGMGVPEMDIPDSGDSPDFGFETFNAQSFKDRVTEEADDNSEEMSTQLLMKISNELSSIKSEIRSLKKEFAEIRGEQPVSDNRDEPYGGFFNEKNDEEISLTGDEMENILTSDFSGTEEAAEAVFGGAFAESAFGEDDVFSESDLGDIGAFDPLRDEDEAALKKLSEQNEEAAGILPVEEEIDFDNLGIDLNAPLEFEEKLQQEEALPLDEIDELQDLRLAGAPDDSSYLEEDPFSPVTGGLDDLSLGEDSLDINLDEAAFNLDLDDFEADPPGFLEDTEDEDAFEMPSLDLSDAVIEGPDFSASLAEVSAEEPTLEDISLDLDAGDFDLEDGFAGFEADAKDDSLAQVIPEAFEIGAKEAAVTLDDDPEIFAEEDPIALDYEPEAFTGENSIVEVKTAEAAVAASGDISSSAETDVPVTFKSELRNVLSYMDHLLESLPEEKIEEFAKSEYFDTYKKIFKDLGLV
jgi:hypothetical protein